MQESGMPEPDRPDCLDGAGCDPALEPCRCGTPAAYVEHGPNWCVRCPRCGLNSMTVGTKAHVCSTWNDMRQYDREAAIRRGDA